MVTILYIHVALLFVIKICAFIERGHNYTFYEITSFNAREREVLYSLHVTEDKIFFLNGVSNEAAIPMDVVVENTELINFEQKLWSNDIQYTYTPYKTILKPLENEVLDEFPDITNTFQNYENIIEWIDKKCKYSQVLFKRHIAKTSQKRNMFYVKLSSGRKKSAVFVMGGEQGRDKMSPAIILNFINDLLVDQKLWKLTDYYDFYFLPVFNPDGYEYSMNENRFWAKNRKVLFPNKPCPGNRTAVGVNVDRNWYIVEAPFTSESHCNGVYIGHRPFSEEESKIVQVVLNDMAARLMAFINVRGFEQLITIPYAHTSEYCNNHNILMDMLSAVTTKLYIKHNTTYYFGNSARFFYNFSGNCADWVKKTLNSPIVYTVYMQRDTFLPESSQIRSLSDQFLTIMNETLVLARDIYDPLFNNEMRLIFMPTMIIFIFITRYIAN